MSAENPQLAIVKGTIHPNAGIGLVHHTVSDLDRQLEFYQTVIGFQVHWRDKLSAGLGVGNKDLLILTETREAKRYYGTTGMYHFAILLPSQGELARVIACLISIKYPNSPTDHVMTKTTYLDDPEGNNIEIYAESPEDGFMGVINGQIIVQRTDGTYSSGREPVNLKALFSRLIKSDSLDEGMPSETKLGHVHLYVSNMGETLHFYHDILGMDNMGVSSELRMGMVSAGGYHHHIGFNTWVGEGAPPAPADALGVQYFTIELPSTKELGKVTQRLKEANINIQELEKGIQVQDPSKINVILTT